jgi:hypothetical protein
MYETVAGDSNFLASYVTLGVPTTFVILLVSRPSGEPRGTTGNNIVEYYSGHILHSPYITRQYVRLAVFSDLRFVRTIICLTACPESYFSSKCLLS